MISATRRKFMSMVGVGAASAPLAVKQVADAQAMKLTNTDVTLTSGDGGGPGLPPSRDDYERNVCNASDYIELFGLPDSVKQQLWADCWISTLDIDIAVKRSWSMAVKFQEQRQRNYARRLASMRTAGGQYRARSLLKQTLGFDWPW